VRHNERGDFPNENTAQFSAFFGYENCNGELTIDIPSMEVSGCFTLTNQFLPQFTEDQGQPEDLLSGTHSFVFQVDFTGTAEPTWELSCDGSGAWNNTAIADTDADCCGNGICQGDPIGENSENCSEDCFCGNGTLDPGEECEPTRKVCIEDSANAGEDCLSDIDCGDIVIDRCTPIEEVSRLQSTGGGACQPVDAGNDCRDDCIQPRCGNNLLDAGETCDGTDAEACGDLGCNEACECNEEPDDGGQVPPPPTAPGLELRGNCISSLVPLQGFQPTLLGWGLGFGLSLGSLAYLRKRNGGKK
jgi:hypothetical protein